MSSPQKPATGQNAKSGQESRVVTKVRNIKEAISQNFKAVTTQAKGVTGQNKTHNIGAGTSQSQNVTAQNNAGTGTSQNISITSQNNNTGTSQNNNATLTSQNNNQVTSPTSQNNNQVTSPTSQNNNQVTSPTSQNNNQVTSPTSQNNNQVTSPTSQNNIQVTSPTSQNNTNNNIASNNKGVSALIKSSSGQVSNTQDMAEKKGPSKKQLEKWTSSIYSLLADPDGIKYFRQFLEDKESDDEKGELTKYIDFYVECEQYKNEFKVLEEKALKIYEKYLRVGADQELPAGDDCADIGDKLDEDGLEGVTVFDKPQTTIVKTMADGIYVEFCWDMKNKLKI